MGLNMTAYTMQRMREEVFELLINADMNVCQQILNVIHMYIDTQVLAKISTSPSNNSYFK